MSITKTIQTPNGVNVSHHRAVAGSVNYANNEATVNVASWPTAQHHADGFGLVWMWALPIATADLANAEAALIADASGPLYGGTLG